MRLALKPADPLCKGRQKALRPDPRTTAAQSQTSRLTKTLFARRYSRDFIRNTGKPGIRAQNTAKITARRKDANGVRWKNLLRRYEVRRHWPENSPSL